MKTYARIEAGSVVELLRTETDPAKLFHPSLHWVEVSNPAVTVGWLQSATGFSPPPPPPEPPAPIPTVTELHAKLNDLAAKVAALTPH